MKKKVELVVISNVHLGTFGCHAQELFNYLKSNQNFIWQKILHFLDIFKIFSVNLHNYSFLNFFLNYFLFFSYA